MKLIERYLLDRIEWALDNGEPLTGMTRWFVLRSDRLRRYYESMLELELELRFSDAPALEPVLVRRPAAATPQKRRQTADGSLQQTQAVKHCHRNLLPSAVCRLLSMPQFRAGSSIVIGGLAIGVAAAACLLVGLFLHLMPEQPTAVPTAHVAPIQEEEYRGLLIALVPNIDDEPLAESLLVFSDRPIESMSMLLARVGSVVANFTPAETLEAL